MHQSARMSWESSFRKAVPSIPQEPESVKVVSKSKSILDGRNWKDPRLPAKGEKVVSTFSPPGRPPSAVLGHGDILHEPTITGDVLHKMRYDSGAESAESAAGDSRGSGVISMDMIVSGRPITPSSPASSVSRGVHSRGYSKSGSVASEDKYKYQIEVQACLQCKLDAMLVMMTYLFQWDITHTDDLLCCFPQQQRAASLARSSRAASPQPSTDDMNTAFPDTKPWALEAAEAAAAARQWTPSSAASSGPQSYQFEPVSRLSEKPEPAPQIPIVMPPMPVLRKSIAGAAPSGECWHNQCCSLPPPDAPCHCCTCYERSPFFHPS